METGRAVEWSREENYKFKLSEFREKLLSWLEDTRGEKGLTILKHLFLHHRLSSGNTSFL